MSRIVPRDLEFFAAGQSTYLIQRSSSVSLKWNERWRPVLYQDAMSNDAVPLYSLLVLGVMVVLHLRVSGTRGWVAFIGIPGAVRAVSIRRHLSVIRASFSVTVVAKVSRGLALGKIKRV